MITNQRIAAQLQTQARTLEEQRQNLYRIRAYRRAAHVILTYPHELDTLLKKSDASCLERLPGIGKHLAVAISHYVQTSEWKSYEELTGKEKNLLCEQEV